MRDIIWTIIVIWLIYKLIDVFKAISVKKAPVRSHAQPAQPLHHSKKDLQKAMRNHLDKDGEYVDFEELK